MRLIALFLFLLLPPSYAGQLFSSLEAVENKNTTLISNAAGSDEKIIETVTASGYGTSVDAAAQNAAENALTQVVGSLIDAETQIQKQKEIRDGVISKTKVIKKDMIIWDPGIGFAKSTYQNLQILSNLDKFKSEFPLLLGPSRKRFIGDILGEPDPIKRDI